MKSLDGALKIEDLPPNKFNPIAFLFFFLSFIGLDRLYFQPKKFWSYAYAVIGISFPYWVVFGDRFYAQDSSEMHSVLLIYSILSMTMPLWYGMILNPYKTGGYWQYRDVKKRQKAMNKLAVSIKEFTTQQIAKY